MANAVDNLVTLTLTGTGDFGNLVGYSENIPICVFGGIPGEIVEARIIRINEERTEAIVEKVIVPSPFRRIPICDKFGECSGCQWQHIDYSHQLELKQLLVKHHLRAEGIDDSLVGPVVPAPSEFGYRNHARFTVRRRQNQFGFINRVTRRFVPISMCHIMAGGINNLMSSLEGKCAETSQFSIRYGVNTDSYLIQPKLNNSEVSVCTGQKSYFEMLSNHRFKVSSPSFFQVNTDQAENLAEIVRQRLSLSGEETVIDAYAGVATFAVLLSPFVKRMIAIEESGAAVKDARDNIRELKNVELLEARTESVLPHLGRLADAIIIDPSRNGCHPGALRTLNFFPPKRLVYISCNPEALARDLRVLTHGPYLIEDITPVDLFPQTYHVESVATLKFDIEKESAFSKRQRLILASASPRRAETLTAMGLNFETAPPNIDELNLESLSPEEQAMKHARNKALAAASAYNEGTIIAADTVVAVGAETLGKPDTEQEATEMLQRLRGKTHRVITAVAVTDAATGETLTRHRITTVTMRSYTDLEIAAYIASGRPMDKAGGYGIQDDDFHPVARIGGCHSNVVGLPVCLMLELLLELGVHPELSANWHPKGSCPDCKKWLST